MELKDIERPPKKLIVDLKKTSAATVYTTLWNLGFKHVWMLGIKPLLLGTKIVGPAVTLKYISYREDRITPPDSPASRSAAQYKAIESLKPGDVVVVDACGRPDAGVFGDCMVTALEAKGTIGLVVDGAVRDAPFIREMKFPVFVRDVTPAHTGERLIPQSYNVPVDCGDVQVTPGDIIMADDDGVMVIPKEKAAEVAKISLDTDFIEVYSRKMLKAGRPMSESYPPRKEWLTKPPI